MPRELGFGDSEPLQNADRGVWFRKIFLLVVCEMGR